MTQVHPIIRRLKAKRIYDGLSQARLAEKLGYDQAAVNRWESGIDRPSWSSLLDWCHGLGYELDLRWPR